MTVTFNTRLLATLVAVLLAIASSASAVRADESSHDGPLDAPAPTTSAGHHDEEEDPDMARQMAGGNARDYDEGDRLTYRIRVTQTLQPKGPEQAEPQSASLDLILTETVTEDDDGLLVTLDVTESSAEGFLAAAEETSALERRVQFRPGPDTLRLALKPGSDGKPDLLDSETTRAYGDKGAIRMVDMALKAHLLNPVIPSDGYSAGDNFKDTGAFPASWAAGYQPIDGSITVDGPAVEEGRDVVKVGASHISGANLLRTRALDNAVDALQGKEKPVPNDFFAGTLFHALFPKGSTYESLMPGLPLETQPQARRRKAVRRRRFQRRTGLLAAGCLMLLALSACSDPARNVDVVSLNLDGVVQINHQGVLDEATGILISSEATATARLAGNVYPIPDHLLSLVPPHLAGLAGAGIGMDVDWTITEQLEGEVPQPSALESMAPAALVAGGAALLAIALIVFLSRRKLHRSDSDNEPAETTAPAESD